MIVDHFSDVESDDENPPSDSSTQPLPNLDPTAAGPSLFPNETQTQTSCQVLEPTFAHSDTTITTHTYFPELGAIISTPPSQTNLNLNQSPVTDLSTPQNSPQTFFTSFP